MLPARQTSCSLLPIARYTTMKKSRLPLAGALLLVVLASPPPVGAEESLLESDVLPILTKNCLGCHGGLRQKGGLDLRTVAAMRKGGKSGPAVQAGDANGSE